MKKFLLIIFLLFVGYSTLRGQWFSQYATPDRNALYSVQFLNPDIGWAAGRNGIIHRTTNGGANWSLITSGSENNLYSISVLDVQNVFIVGSGGILFNLGNMSYPYTSNTNKNLRSIYFVNENYGWAVGDSGTIIRTTDSGLNWSSQVSGVSDSLYAVHFANQDSGWAAGHNGVICKTTDGGNSWTNQSIDTYLDFYSIYFTDSKTGWVAGYNKIYHTVDGGNIWTPQSVGLSNLYYSLYFIDSTGWVVGNYGAIFNTTNRGVSWTRQPIDGQPYFSIPLFSVCFINKYIGWAVGDGGIILKTTNGGGSFITSTITLNASAGDQTIEVFSNTGFSIGDNIIINPGGANEETNIISGFGSILLSSPLQFDHHIGELIVKLSPTDVDDEYKFIPDEFLLNQNYPNPFNPSTRINWQSPVGSHQTIKVYDVLGKEVAILVDEYKSAGSYEVEFNASSFSSGIYFYQLRAGDFLETKKMLYLR